MRSERLGEALGAAGRHVQPVADQHVHRRDRRRVDVVEPGELHRRRALREGAQAVARAVPDEVDQHVDAGRRGCARRAPRRRARRRRATRSRARASPRCPGRRPSRWHSSGWRNALAIVMLEERQHHVLERPRAEPRRHVADDERPLGLARPAQRPRRPPTPPASPRRRPRARSRSRADRPATRGAAPSAGCCARRATTARAASASR